MVSWFGKFQLTTANYFIWILVFLTETYVKPLFLPYLIIMIVISPLLSPSLPPSPYIYTLIYIFSHVCPYIQTFPIHLIWDLSDSVGCQLSMIGKDWVKRPEGPFGCRSAFLHKTRHHSHGYKPSHPPGKVSRDQLGCSITTRAICTN